MYNKHALLFLLGTILTVVECGGSLGLERKLCPPMKNVPQPANRVNTSLVLSRLRAEMRKMNIIQGPPIDAYIITSDDHHQSMYVAERDKRLKYVSGFTGHGLAVLTSSKAALWSPGLYTLQANEELSCDWILIGQTSVDQTVSEWLKDELPGGSRVGADPSLVPNSQWEILSKELSNGSIYLVPVKNNLVDQVWPNRPEYTKREAYVQEIEYAGKTWQHKVSAVRANMKAENCDAFVVTALDEIAWLLNIRGHDIPYLPVLRAYLILTRDQIHFYTDLNKLSPYVKRNLHSESCFSAFCARVHPYDEVWADLRTLAQIWKKVWLPSQSPLSPGVSRAIFLAIPVEKRKSLKSPIVSMKAEKNPVEREGMRRAHVRDAAALCDFMAYFEYKMSMGEKWTELTVSNQLDQRRREQNLSQGISFKSIVGFGPHGALPHYEPNNITAIEVDNSSLLVIDSGGHYTDGTTDVTRTFHFGKPTEEQIESYTRVLMGSINLAMLTFPNMYRINKVDVLARAPLWDAGLDYQHGTGHGIGSFLNVHEGPILISTNHNDDEVFREGHFFSNEPGYYKEDKFGIRLENILEVVNKTVEADGSIKYLHFIPATLVPYEPKLIDINKLSPQQIRWLNEYNTRVRDEIGAELKRQVRMKGFYWMMDKTQYIPGDCRLRGSASKITIKHLLIVQIALTFFMTIM